ncbi:glutamine amidotransferase [Actinocrinis puniceicyclus]|uniref:Lipid II isoglutaminyl synthase (glutamine-hydrolyzing) subunit GatD n=1 Tax=Actinocrinis puniceicyclus TaxID=977794 RepID=A0A8J7WPF9_9ACTN|nr:glutamine amidotransferase [Actinocrinis puniceicyclus]
MRIVWIYPDLLSTYGDQGNALILEYRAAARGHRVERVDVRSDQAVPEQGDIYLIGGGEDRPQRLAAERLRRDPGLTRAAGRGAAVLAVCAGFQLMGHTFYDEQEGVLPGLGLIDVTSHRGSVRCVGEVVADSDPQLAVGGAGLGPLTGFENHMGTTLLGQGVRPLGTVRVGNGNGAGAGTDGAHAGTIAGTYLHGPVLARNPALADLILSWADGDSAPSPVDERWHQRLRKERLAAVGA